MEKEIKISILCENQAKMGSADMIFLAQHGFSAFIDSDPRILFDTGASDVFIHNAKVLRINLNPVDWIVLSHGHWDHTNGLEALPEMKNTHLLVHPGVFKDRRRASGEYNGTSLNQEKIAEKYHLILSKEPYKISDTIYFLGEIPRLNVFESQYTSFFYMDGGEKHPDFIMDDTALAIKTNKGLIIVTGCSHAGICNIIEYARKVTHQKEVFAVMGGFHLLGNPIQLEKTIEYFKKNRVEHLYPMHCTDLPSLSKFHETFGIKKLCAGDTVTFNP